MAMMGAKVLGAIGQYQADKARNKAERAWQAYSNTMTRLSDSVNQNAITSNAILAMETSVAQGLQIERNAIDASAQVENDAAAAGVTGRSVNRVMFGVMRNAAERENERQINLRNSRLETDQQRLNSRMSAEMQQDYTYLPKPKLASYLLGAASGAGQTYMDNRNK